MTDRDALLAAVLAAPDDDLPRLVYTDWLEEHGEHERAEFIRVQVELERTTGCGRCNACEGHLSRVNPKCPRHALRRREGESWAAVRDSKWIEFQISRDFGNVGEYTGVGRITFWAPPKAEGCRSGIDVVVRRGFVESVTCSSTDCLAHLDDILKAHPVRKVRLTDDPRDIEGQGGLWRSVVKVETGLAVWKNDRWKGVTFELPEASQNPAGILNYGQ